MKLTERLERYRDMIGRLRVDLTQRSKELSFFINSSKALTSTLEYNKVVRIIMDRAQRLIKCNAWSLMLLDEDSQRLRFVVAKGSRGKEIKRIRLKLGQGIAGWVAKTGQPAIINDVRKDRRFNKTIDRIARYKTKSVLCVPIINNKRTVGVIEMINKLDGRPFEEKDRDLLGKLVDQAAIALERANLYERMSKLAITDDLTKLYNFRYMDQILEREIKRCQRYGSVLSMIFLDLDYFKNVNDTHGHLIGSKVLIEMARLLLQNLRTVDIIARYGGDEFVVILPETNVQTAHRITQRLHKSLYEHVFLEEDGLDLKITASFGISGYPEHAQTKRDLVRLADQAMYTAKNNGRNQICVAEKVIK